MLKIAIPLVMLKVAAAAPEVPAAEHAAPNSAGSIKVASSASAFGLLTRLRDVSEDYETKGGSRRRQGRVQRP